MSREFGICGEIVVSTDAGPLSGVPTPPVPVVNDGLYHDQGNIIPHNGTLINSVQLPTAFSTGATGDIVGLLGTTTVWTVACTDLHANCDGFVAVSSFWYDNTNDKLWIFGLDTGTTPDTYYTAYVTLETGVVTNIGNVAATTDPTAPSTFGRCAVSRGTITSGDFTLHFADRDIVLDEATGAENSNTAQTNVTESGVIGNYATLDDTIWLSNIYSGDSNSMATMTRNQRSCLVPLVSYIIGANDGTSYPIAWGDKVKIHAGATTVNRNLLRTFTRIEFDAWLQLLADRAGVE